MPWDNFILAYKNIKERKTRVFLTLLGIAIGIMAIVSLMGIGEGMQQAITGELSSLSDTILVFTGSINAGMMSGGMGGGITTSDDRFTDRDLEDIQRIEGLRDVSAVYFGAGQVTFNGETQTVSLLGVDPASMSTIFGIDVLGLSTGSFIEEGDQFKCLVGNNIAYDTYDADMRVDGKIKINEKNFVVKGIYKKQGSGMSIPTDDYIHLSTHDFQKITGQDDISGIIVRVYDVTQVENIANEIELAINENHGTDDFADVTTMASILESIQQILGIIQMVLIAIAGIALVVASIGIMNTMLTSVMERTHEIGIMKAIGAKYQDIMIIFLMEGILISLIGGATGITLGFVGAKAFSVISAGWMGGDSLAPVITIQAVILAVGVAIFVGVISSLYPARKAAKMSPIEAVRYE